MGLSKMSSKRQYSLEPFLVRREGTKLSGWRRPGAGRRLLLLHGLAGATTEWKPLLAELDADLDIVALDSRGHGESERHPDSINAGDHLADCRFVLSELGIRKVIVLGQSMGGIVATRLAAESPTEFIALILVDAGMAGTAPDKDFSGLRSWLENQDVETEVAMDCIQLLDATDRWHEWQSLAVPALICFGERSFIPEAEASRMQELRPDFEYELVPNSGHDIHLDQPLRLAEHINSFCARVDS